MARPDFAPGITQKDVPMGAFGKHLWVVVGGLMGIAAANVGYEALDTSSKKFILDTAVVCTSVIFPVIAMAALVILPNITRRHRNKK